MTVRQALHILKKDIRGHWYEIAITLAVTAAFAVIGARGSESRSVAGVLILLVLPLSWWTLIARVIHEEALPGDRQFWLTRPYNRGSLLGAKILLILLCVNVPMLLADAFIVSAYGFPLPSVLPGLLWSQVLLTATFLLPITALSALTTGMVPLLVTLTAIAAVFTLRNMLPEMSFEGPWFTLEWVRTYFDLLIGAFTALVVLVWQYRHRRTTALRWLAAAGLMLISLSVAILPWRTAFWIQSRFSVKRLSEPGIQLVFASDRSWAGSVLTDANDVRLIIPVTLKNIPAGMLASPTGLMATFEAPDGTTWKADKNPWRNLRSEGQVTQLEAHMDKAFYDRIRLAPLVVRGSFYVTLFGNSRSSRLPFRNQSVAVPGVGQCTATATPGGRNYFLVCQSAFRAPNDAIWVDWVDLGKGSSHEQAIRTEQSYSPFPADVGINPISQFGTYYPLQAPASVVDVNTMEPLAYVQREFEIKNLRLADFEQK